MRDLRRTIAGRWPSGLRRIAAEVSRRRPEIPVLVVAGRDPLVTTTALANCGLELDEVDLRLTPLTPDHRAFCA